MLVRKSTYDKVVLENEELSAELEELRDEIESLKNTNAHLANVLNQNGELKRQNDALLNWTEELELKFLELDLYGDLSDPEIPDVNPIPEKKESTKKTRKRTSRTMLKALEEKLKTIPDGTRGTGGIDIINEDGKEEMRSFTSKNELVGILKDAKKGKIKIVEQAGL